MVIKHFDFEGSESIEQKFTLVHLDINAKARHCSQLGKHFRPSLMLDLFILYGDSRKLIFGLPLNVYLSSLGNVALIK